MLAKPEWNPERFEAPRRATLFNRWRIADRYFMMLILAAATALILAGSAAFVL